VTHYHQRPAVSHNEGVRGKSPAYLHRSKNMGRLFIFLAVAALLAGIVARSVVRGRRARRNATPEINKHPERLDQMLDPTDDA
jgi:hypothetical protein